MYRHAILYQTTDGGYYLYNGKSHQVAVPKMLEHFLTLFEYYDVDVLWAMPNTEFSKQISWNDFDLIDRDRCKVFPSKPTESRSKKPSFMSIRRLSNHYEKDRYFAFPAHGEWNAYNDGQWFLSSPFVLAQTLSYLAKEFEEDPLWGPGNMGMKVLKRTFAKRGYQIENTELTDRLRTVLNGAMARPVWKQFGGLSGEQKEMLYIHGYDKNGQYLGAAQSVHLGNGRPVWVDGSAFDLKSIGFWQYQITDVSGTAFDGDRLPCPLDINRQWASTDLLLAARTVGVEFEVLGGIVWTEGKKYLEDWAREMWAHRARLRDDAERYPGEIARENAAGAAKLAANNLMGRLASEKSRELFRPDWNWLIVHKAIATQCHSFNRMLTKYHIKPVLVCTDSFWVVSNESDAEKAIPGILEYQSEQRGYKSIGSLPMVPGIAEIFEHEEPEKINTYLKQFCEEK